MDILRYMAEKSWEWIGGLPIGMTAFFCRCSMVLLLSILFGHCVRQLAQEKQIRNTLPLQASAFLAALLVTLTFSFSCLEKMTDNARGTLFVAALCGCVLLPFVAVQYLVRRKGFQRIAWKIILGAELVLLIVQIIVLWR